MSLYISPSLTVNSFFFLERNDGENVTEANVNRFDYLSSLKHPSEGFHGEEAAVTETGHVCDGGKEATQS